MSNMPHLKGPVVPRGDMGLGFCLSCLAELKQRKPDAADGQAPQFAITNAPTLVPIPGPNGMVAGVAAVAVPTCFDHLTAGQQQGNQRRPLLVAGSMP